ncbi:hypothetical protein CVD19_17795 [Bacillus sp. T33-2]|nr:hypothetical protein CVD19_17795 [Bacillus sp. T33-2]
MMDSLSNSRADSVHHSHYDGQFIQLQRLILSIIRITMDSLSNSEADFVHHSYYDGHFSDQQLHFVQS